MSEVLYTIKTNLVTRSVRMTIPMPIVRALGISPGDEVIAREENGKMIVEKEGVAHENGSKI